MNTFFNNITLRIENFIKTITIQQFTTGLLASIISLTTLSYIRRVKKILNYNFYFLFL